MKPAAKFTLATACLFLVIMFPGVGLPWGDAPTHFGISYEAGDLAGVDSTHLPLFVRASACPDIANTLLFKSTGRTYVHDLTFVSALLYVVDHPSDWRWKRYWKPQWLTMALGWQAHLVADEVAHTEYVPEEPVKHSLVEFEVDICVYYEKQQVPVALGFNSWKDVNVGEDCCDPWLIFWASYIYTKGKKPVYRWMTVQALNTLKTTIEQEYNLIAKRGDSNAAEAHLAFLVPGEDWEDNYDASVAAVAAALP